MSKSRLVITALLTDGQGVAEVAARYGVHRSWVYRLKARYDAEGDRVSDFLCKWSFVIEGVHCGHDQGAGRGSG